MRCREVTTNSNNNSQNTRPPVSRPYWGRAATLGIESTQKRIHFWCCRSASLPPAAAKHADIDRTHQRKHSVHPTLASFHNCVHAPCSGWVGEYMPNISPRRRVAITISVSSSCAEQRAQTPKTIAPAYGSLAESKTAKAFGMSAPLRKFVLQLRHVEFRPCGTSRSIRSNVWCVLCGRCHAPRLPKPIFRTF